MNYECYVQHVGLQTHGEKLKKGVEKVLKAGKVKFFQNKS